MKKIIVLVFSLFYVGLVQSQNVNKVNPFIGTSNFGATNPGAVAPRGMLSISPFNVSFDTVGIKNPLEKDSRWLSNPYVNENTFLTGFSHVNMSGVGCPDLGVILTMPITGALKTHHLNYGTVYKNEEAHPGYYSVYLEKYGIKAEMTASHRSGVSRYWFPQGQAHLLLNLGLGLTNEQGAMVKVVNSSQVEGVRMVGSFCYNSPEKAYPVYFVLRVSEPAQGYGVWKTPQYHQGAEAQWMTYNGKVRIKENFNREVVGDSIGAYFSYHFKKPTAIEVKVGISYVSIENARENLDKEIGDLSFDEVLRSTSSQWEEQLSTIEVEGGDDNDKTVFYTSLYHMLLHPNILNDINGQYPKSNGEIGKTSHTRYTVFSLWDTYRNYHQLLTLLYPNQQLQMIQTMLDIYDESGWLPKWELNSTETFTMVGDPASVVIADSYLRGIRNFDVEKAFEAMKKGSETLTDNPIRPGVEEYWRLGYVSVDSDIPGPVSVTQEYNIADFAIAQLAKSLGKNKDYKKYSKQSLSYRKLFDKHWNLLRPKHKNGKWYEPFDPDKGANFEHNVGYIEGNAWQYAFMVPQDIKGLIELMGGKKSFVKNLNHIFETHQFDMANEPDMGYPFLYNYVKGSEWLTQKRVHDLLKKYFVNAPSGIPGNDDTGVMSAWAVCSMIGLYPVSPAQPLYALTSPKFDRIVLNLDKQYYPNEKIEILSNASQGGIYIQKIWIDNKPYHSYFITDEMLKSIKQIRFELGDKPLK